MESRETSTRPVRVAASVLALALALGACGGGGAGGGTASPGSGAIAGSASDSGVLSDVAAVADDRSRRMAASGTPARAPLRADAANLLSNPGFEAGMTGWVNWDNAQVVDGAGASGSLRALRVGTAAGGAGLDVAGIVGGERYRLTSQARVSDPSEVVFIGINILDDANATIAQQAATVSATAYALAALEIEAPADAARAVVFVWKNAGSGYAYVDEMTLAQVGGSTPPPAGNLVANGGFEQGLAGWTNWGNSTAVAGQSSSGTYAVRVGSAAGGLGHDVATAIVAGTTYSLSGQGKVSVASEVAYLGLSFFDASGTKLLEQNVPVNSTAYSTAKLDLVAPANATRAMVYVWKNAGSGFAYVDDIALAPGGASPPPSPPPVPGNLLANPGFEDAMAGWSNWANASAVTGQSSSGAYAMRVGSAAGGFGQDVLAGIDAGKTYSLSARVRKTVASDAAYLGLTFLDAAGNRLQQHSVPVTTTAYFRTTLHLVAPANAVWAVPYVWKDAGSGFVYVDDVVLVALDFSGDIPVASWPDTLLQVGRDSDAYWVADGVWAPWGLTRDTYAGKDGTTYEQYTGFSPEIGANGEVAFRLAWKWPTCCTEIKSFPGIVSGRKPGWYSAQGTPGGYSVQLSDGTWSQARPAGATPGTFLPLQLPLASLNTSFDYRHLAAPTGRGHLAYDIFLQDTPTQAEGFGAGITHEINIPLDYWGGYGQYPTRNPDWYDHDVTIDGILFHVYAAKDPDGGLRPNFNGGWKFIVFEPDRPIPPGTLDLARIVNYVTTRKDAFGTPWANGNEYAVSVELGVEPEYGVGDIQVTNYRVWK